MKWSEIVETYPDKWVVVDNIVETVVDGITMIDEVDLIAVFSNDEVNELAMKCVNKHPDASILSTGGNAEDLEV